MKDLIKCLCHEDVWVQLMNTNQKVFRDQYENTPNSSNYEEDFLYIFTDTETSSTAAEAVLLNMLCIC